MATAVRTSRSSRATQDTYHDPLVYDIIHEPGTREEVAALIRLAMKWGRGLGHSNASTTGRARKFVWLEPGCGTGRCLRALAKKGHACVGLDISPGMVEFARRSLTEESPARVLVGDMRAMDARPVLAALKRAGAGKSRPVVSFCPHNSVRHLASDVDMVRHLASMGRVLRRFGGIYFVGIGLIGEGHQRGEEACETVFQGSRRGTWVREIIDFVLPAPGSRGPASRREQAYKHLSVHDVRGEREFTSSYTLHTFTRRQWLAVVKRAGMIEQCVVGAWGEAFDDDRLHYAYRVLAPLPA